MLKNLAFTLFLLSCGNAGAEQVRQNIEHILENGLRVVLVETTATNVVRAALCVSAGSADEIDKVGTANLLSKVLAAKFMTGMNDNSVQYASESSTSVGYDQSIYYFCGTVGNLGSFLKSFGGLLNDSSVSDGDIEEAKKAVLRSIATSNEKLLDHSVATREARKCMYWHSGYGPDGEGTVDGVQLISPEDVMKFKNSHYSPENAVLVLCFDPNKVNPKNVMALVQQEFGQLLKAPNVKEVRLQEPDHHGSVVTIMKSSDQVSVPVVELYYHVPNFNKQRARALNTEVYLRYLDKALHKSLVVDLKVATSIAFTYALWNKDSGDFCVSITLGKGIELNEALTAITSEIKYIASENISKEQLGEATRLVFGANSYEGVDIGDVLDKLMQRLGAGQSLNSLKGIGEEANKCSLGEVCKQGRDIFSKDPAVICILKPQPPAAGGSSSAQ
jgi:predicted Zn-dependent peptidase